MDRTREQRAASSWQLRDAIARGIVPGPRVLTSIRQLNENTGGPDQLREAVRNLKDDGADAIKIFASKSIRDGGGMTMTPEQIEAACGEARSLGLRTLVHAHGADSIKASTLAGCTQIEHGVFADQEALTLMAQRGTYFDPNIGVVLQNYLQNKARFLGIGNYTEEGFAYMEKAIPTIYAMIKQALATKGLKMVFGTDAVSGAHGHNLDELIVRVQQGGQAPMAAIVSGTKNTAWFKNSAGLLTEVTSARFVSPLYIDPTELTGGGRKGLIGYDAQTNFPSPWPGGWWRLRDIMDYERVASDAILE